MYFTNKTYYTGDIFIANLKEKCDDLTFFAYDAELEEECLRITLGDCLFNELIDQLEWDETANIYKLKDGVDEKWGWLINGHTYAKDDLSEEALSSLDYSLCGCGCDNDNCDTFHWDGIIKVIDRRIPPTTINGEVANGVKVYRSYLAEYIYWKWSLSTDTFTSSTGEKTSKTKGTDQASNSDKRIAAHNRFVSWVIDCNSHGKVGLYTFVQHFKDLYPEWQGKCLAYESIW